MLRADVQRSRAGPAPRSLSPVAASERNAARIFNADHCFFVTNGVDVERDGVAPTVAPDDIVVVDPQLPSRSCSDHHDRRHPRISPAQPSWATRADRARRIQPEHPQEIEANPFARGETEARFSPLRAPTTASPTRRNAPADARRQHRYPAFRRGVAAAAFHEFYKDMHAIGRTARAARSAHIRDALRTSCWRDLAGVADHRPGVATRKLDRHIFNRRPDVPPRPRRSTPSSLRATCRRR